MRAICDECKKEFEIEHKTEYLGAMITETYFKCTHCGEKYIVRLDNNSTRKLERRIKNLRETYNNFKNSVMKRARAGVSLDMAIAQHKKEMKRLMKGEDLWRYQTK